MYKVLKKDGSLQDFDWKKVTDGVVRAGGSKDDAEKVAEGVELWLSTVADDGMIKSEELHQKVADVLTEVNPEAGKKFVSYRKPGQ